MKRHALIYFFPAFTADLVQDKFNWET